MGAKPSVKIQTPAFVQSEWQYEPPQSPSNPEYGMYRTLSNKKTGEMIDEYDMSWINEQEYTYYLKSFNWRYNQPNVVNTRFIVEKSTHEFCSQTFVARVYIEHMIVRLSEINDIPFPENLYVLMQALEGYAKIFEHSKYFVIEENQICVDGSGNVKIWVNSDLSINYPNSDHYQDDKNIGEEMMVEKLVQIIGENTDRESEPDLTFLEYFQEKKGFRGKKFEEARVLVLSYARLNETQIPDRFEAVLNLGKEDELTVQENDHFQQSEHYHRDIPQTPQNYRRENEVQSPEWDRDYHPARVQEEPYRSAAHPIAVIPPPVQYQYPQSHYAAPYPNYLPHPNSALSFAPKPFNNLSNTVFKGYPMQSIQPNPQQIQYIPHYTRVQYPVNVINQPPFPLTVQHNQPQIQQPPFQSQISNKQSSSKQDLWEDELQTSSHPKALQQSKRERPQSLIIEKKPSQSKKDEPGSPVHIKVSPLDTADIRVTLYNDPTNFLENYDQNGQQLNRDDSDQELFTELPQNTAFTKLKEQKDFDNSSKTQNQPRNFLQNAEFSDVDDLVAKSLPIKAGYAASNNSPMLNGFGQSDRSAYSHIHSKDHVDSFGLSGSGQGKLKDSALGKVKESGIKGKQNGTKGSTIAKLNKPVVKYYYSLQEQLEIDPDIAADMERYLAM